MDTAHRVGMGGGEGGRKKGGKRAGRPFQDGFCGDYKIAICEILQF